jgi:hypothetical protein
MSSSKPIAGAGLLASTGAIYDNSVALFLGTALLAVCFVVLIVINSRKASK